MHLVLGWRGTDAPLIALAQARLGQFVVEAVRKVGVLQHVVGQIGDLPRHGRVVGEPRVAPRLRQKAAVDQPLNELRMEHVHGDLLVLFGQRIEEQSDLGFIKLLAVDNGDHRVVRRLVHRLRMAGSGAAQRERQARGNQDRAIHRDGPFLRRRRRRP